MQIRVMEYRGSVFIIWIFISVITSASEAVELHTDPGVRGICGDKVILTCKASSPRQFDIKSFLWMSGNDTLCKYEGGHLQNNTPCEYSPQNTLTLTFNDLKRVHEGPYLCKIRTNAGVNESVTSVHILSCFGSFTYFMNSTHATCVFKDVYHIIYMPWFHGDTEIKPISSEFEHDQNSRESIWGTIEVDTRNLSQPYKCCLFGIIGRAAHCQTLKLTSSGSMLRIQWIFAMLEILLVKSLM